MNVMKLIVGCILALSVVGCTDEPASRRALQNQGFTDISFTGYQFASCSDSDTTSTGFIAKNPLGVHVEGVVCCGWSKACTIRW